MQLERNYRVEPTAALFHEAGLNPDIHYRSVRGVPSCVDGETEVLTGDGWVRIDAYQTGTPIGQYNSVSRSIEYRVPIRYIAEDTPGATFYHFKSRGLDMLVSANHRILHTKKFNPTVMRVETAQEIYQQHQRLVGGWDGLVPTTWNMETTRSLPQTEEQLRLQVAVCADGHLPKAGNRVTIALRKRRKISRLRALLILTGTEFTETPAKDADSDHKFYFEPPIWSKSLSVFMLGSLHQLKIVTEEMMFWDGHRGANGHDEFYTSVRTEADIAQWLFVNAGFTSKIGFKQGSGNRKDSWRVGREHRQFAGIRYDNRKTIIEKVAIDKSYCFETSTGYWIARRNGKIFVTGNSGKSVMCVQDIVRWGQLQEPYQGVRRTRFAVVRATYPALESTTIKTVGYWIPSEVWPIVVSKRPMMQRVRYSLADGTKVDMELLFMALENEKDRDQMKSLEVTGIWLNEVFQMDRSIVTTAFERTGRYPPVENDRYGNQIPGTGPTRRGVWMDTNSPPANHWFYEFENNPPKNWKCFVQPAPLLRVQEKDKEGKLVTVGWEPNPLAENIRNLKGGYNYYLDQIDSLTEAEKRVNIENKPGAIYSGKVVYQGFWRDDMRASSELDGQIDGDVIVGMDTTGLNPGAVFLVVIGGTIYQVDEIIGQDMPFDYFVGNLLVPKIRTRFPMANLIVVTDPANPRDAKIGETPIVTLSRAGIRAIPAPTNNLQPRINAVVHFLEKHNGYRVTNNNVITIEGFEGGYRYPELKHSGIEKVYGPKPVKDKFSTAHDSLQYGCLYILRGAGMDLRDTGEKAGWKKTAGRTGSVRRLA